MSRLEKCSSVHDPHTVIAEVDVLGAVCTLTLHACSTARCTLQSLARLPGKAGHLRH